MRKKFILGIYLLGFILLFVLENVKCGYNKTVKSIILTFLGMFIVVFVYLTLNKLNDRSYKDPYALMGMDILHEFLSGKRGVARQLFGIWILLVLPFAIFLEDSPNQCFWFFILPITVISTLSVYTILSGKQKEY
ncbi:hypothetical protein [Thermococcus peptonophilus]|uniref:Uncharacterized protein n=1 Tax=Thermococcus peptonophilus TaxID=53952 RepID=A0A142CV60_9EURY|nr:hypothetical protein [Thermococcus peptonophilus]AMQ18662.1 hypothetical protein A0127_05510 [Thermococcus peptonophilus]